MERQLVKRKFIVTVDGPEVAVASLRPVHIKDAIAEGLRIPCDDVTCEEDPR